MTTPFEPQPCGPGGAGDAVDLESQILCDTLADGTVVGSALAVYDYSSGDANAAPTFVDAATGAPYTPQGTLRPCPGETGCLEPVVFHRTTTSTGNVDHPGRQYDITLPINPGFAVQSLQVDSVTHAANIVWDVADPDGEQFRQDLTSFIDGRLPAAATVTITNPNVGQTICGTAAPMQIHIECLRLDQSPPDLVELVYNGGQDMIINPAYNETPALNPPVAQGNYGYHLLARQDDPGPFPGNPPAGRVDCTNTANRGWETNDVGRTFEIWGNDVAGGVTPTPRGTPVQEITSDGPPAGQRSTVWQTFQAPASGNFIIRVVHGARDSGEIHRITLDNGDTDAAQNGSLINDVTTPAVVYGGNAWTTFEQSIPLVGGSTYTLALSTTEANPDNNARGGLFTDMRAYIDRPDQRATAVTDDDTCTVSVTETTTACQDELWSPVCVDGSIDSWQNAETGQILSNAAFWGQAPAPIPGACPASAAAGGGGSVAANLVHSYQVCATVGGVRTTLERVVITDASGGVLTDTFIGPDGGPVPTPARYTIGSCTDTAYVNDVVLCDVTPAGSVSFLRKYVQSINTAGNGTINSYRDFDFAGNIYEPVGTVSDCSNVSADREPVCWTDTATGGQIHTGTIRHQDGINADGWLLFDQNRALVLDTSGVTFVPCSADPFSTTGLCTVDGTPLAVVTRFDHATGTYVDDGWINLLTGAFTSGNPPVGVTACGSSRSVDVEGTFCDMSGTTVNALVLLEYHFNPDGTVQSVRIVNATTGATHTVVGTITVCPADSGSTQPEQDLEILCDVNAGVATPFVRDYRRNATGDVTSVSNYTLAGAPYTPTGTVGVCSGRDSESVILCDANGTRFLRTYTYGPTGAVSGTFDTNLTGTPFAPVGVVGLCTQPTAADLDFVQAEVQDNNGCFLRRFTIRSSDGVVTATQNLNYDGTTRAVSGTVGPCSNCCPVVVAEGCTNTGSGRYVATRATNGTITLQDAVTGAAVTQANIVACTQAVAPTSVAINAQHQLVTPASPWTPPAGVTLTSVTFTVLSGTATVVDQSGDSAAGLPAGLSATWNAEDHSTLQPPQSITSVGGSVYVNWTAKA